MKLTAQRNFGIFWLIAGAALLAAGCLSGADGSLLSGFGGGFIACGAVRLLRVHRLGSDPERAADYEASLTDERTAYVSTRARSAAFIIGVYVQLIGGLLARFVFHETLVGLVLCYLTGLQGLLYTVFFWRFNRKY